ncbi:MAG: beta strand repeat-containing protein, partial [Gemmatimonadaceae bacterium]
PAVAQVGADGTITGLVVGNTTINAIIDSKIGSLPLAVVSAAAASIAVVPASATVALGKTAQLTAELRDQAGNVLTGQSVVWSSANPSVAGVNGSGLVTALAAGSTTITAASGALSAQATLTVSGTGVGSVAVSPAAVQLQVGASQELDATVLDVNGGAMPNAAISWSSAAPSVATVSAAGRVSAVSAGVATITATASGKSGSATVTVSAPAALAVASVSVTFNSPSVQVGQATQAVAVARDANGQVVTGRPVLWLSDDPVLASVSATGLVTALAGGSATIAARVDGVTGLATLAIGAPAPLPVYSVQLAVSPNAIATGQTAASTATLRDSLGNSLSGRTIGWSSSRSTVASVGLGGTVTGVSAGSATITATSEGKSGSAGVSVSGSTPTVASVSVAVTASSLTPGQSTQATATVRDSSGASLAGYTVTWTSSNTAAATVSPSGLVTAVAAGASTITATAGGKSGSAAVNVTNPVVASVTVALSSGSLTVGQTTQGTATAKDATGATIAGAVVVWSSSNTAVAAVSAAGLVSAVAAGTANISATSGGKTGAAPVSVTAPATGGTVPSIAAALPQASVSTAWVAPTGRTLPVNAGGNLQAALDSARRGDEIVVQAGATFTGNFVLRAKSGTGVVLVRTSAIASLPPLGSRVAASDTVYMPRLVSANNGQTIATTAGASGWRLVGLHVTIAPNAAGVNNPNYGLIALGEISPAQTLANMPRDLVLDRMVIRAQPSTYTARCVALNSAYSAIINSQLLECHGKGFDSQAIVGLNGSGPFLIENNRLEAAGEVIMFGGGDPDIVNLIPGDITIRRNYLTRPMSWQGVWTVKNLFELKNAQRVLFEANALDNHWVDAQAGSAVVLGTVEQDGYCDWCVVQDVTFQYNHLHNVAAGFNVFAQCGHPSPGAPYGCSNGAGQPTRRVTLRHNLLTNVGVAGLGAGGSTARVFLLQEDVHDLLIEHNTGFAPYSYATFHGTGSGAKQRFTFHRNIGGASQYDWFSTYGSGDAANTASFTSPYLVERNGFVTTTASLVPTGSLTVSSVAAVGFVNPVWPNGNWSLGAGSPFAGLGADYAVLSSNLAGVR